MRSTKSSGFSILEVMVALGLLGIGGYFLMELSKSGAMGQKTLLAQDDARVLTDNMAQMLSDPTACVDTFGGLDPVDGNGSNLTSLKDKSGNVQFSTGQKYGNRGVQLNGLIIGGTGNDTKTLIPRWAPGTTANTGTAFVQVDWLQTGSAGNQGSGPQHLYRYFLVYVANISSNQIIRCTASTGGGSISGSGTPNFLALWKTASSVKESVMVQDSSSGNIGIGTASPAATLDVNGAIRPGNAGVSTGGGCSPEGAFAYDLATHSPVFCNSSGLWAGMGGKASQVLGSGQMNMDDGTSGSVHCQAISYTPGWPSSKVTALGSMYYVMGIGYQWSAWSVFFKDMNSAVGAGTICIDSGGSWRGQVHNESTHWAVYGQP